jgi:hypothetical protein
MHFIAKSNMFFSHARLVTTLFIACISIVDAVHANPHESSNPHVLITKTSQGDWSVTYSADMPVNKIVFMRNPDTSRTSRWSPLDKEMMRAVDEKGAEYIARKDGNAFDQVSLSLTPSYTHLPKDYAPFSPFSDGGHLSHSGRYFACANTCENVKNEWQINVQAPQGEHVIVNGAVYYKPINWVDSDSGRNFYVGKQSPVEGDSFIALVDEQLPNILKDSLTEQLPKLMQYFESKLGIAKGPKPMLFASYSNKPGSSSQGGTLPDQIFMHWDFDDLDERVKSREYVYQTLWFYAHEAAHFFQKGPTGEALFGAPEHSWIHEGGGRMDGKARAE